MVKPPVTDPCVQLKIVSQARDRTYLKRVSRVYTGNTDQ